MKNYTDFFDVFKDLDSYLSLRSGEQLNLSNVPVVAQNKWPWIVENWNGLYTSFKEVADGDDEELSALEQMSADVMSYKLGNTKNNPLENKEKFKEYNRFLDQVDLISLNFSPEELQAIGRETERISSLDLEDFQSMKSFLNKYTSQKSIEIGLGDEKASRIYGTTIIPAKRSPTVQDLLELDEIQNLISIIENIIIDFKQTIKRPPNLLIAANNNISEDSSVSIKESYLSYSTTVFEISLEHMAKKYLGSEQLWYELVTVNGLKPPFVDEVGVKLSLVAPPAVNNVTISTSNKNEIFVGTKIGIGSYKYKEETRIVEKIVINENDTMILFLSGAQNINKFLPVEGAFVRIYKPNTIRSNQIIIIPSDNPGVSQNSVPTPGSDTLKRLNKVLINFGVDIYKDEKTNDFIIDSNGNFKMAAGYTNVKQAALMALRTALGELPFHPDYGINTNISQRFYGSTDEAIVFTELLRDALLRDSRFSNVEISGLSTTSNSMSMSINVYITGSNQPITLSFVG